MTVIYCTQAEITAALASLPELIDASGDVVNPRHIVTGLIDRLYVGQKDTAPPAVVVATPTIQDGLVLRWYRDIEAAESSSREIVSASSRGVMLNGNVYLHTIPPAWIADAQRACDMLQHDQRDRAQEEYATHKHARVFSGELSEVKR
jgi:hypothetical protein